MRHERSHTKVIATIGPATRNKEVLEKMFHEGVDVCRFNCSHDTYEEHKNHIEKDRCPKAWRITGTNIQGFHIWP